MTMALLAHSDHGAIQRIQCGKQRRRTVALIVVRHRGAASLLQRQARLSSIQGLNLAFFIYTQNDRMLGRFQIEPDDGFHFLGEPLVLADLEGLDQSEASGRWHAKLAVQWLR